MTEETDLQVGNVDDNADKNDSGGAQPTDLADTSEPSETEKIEETPTEETEPAPESVQSAEEPLFEESAAVADEALSADQVTEEPQPVEKPEEESAPATEASAEVCTCDCECVTPTAEPEPPVEQPRMEEEAAPTVSAPEPEVGAEAPSTDVEIVVAEEVPVAACVCDCVCESLVSEPEVLADQPRTEGEAAPAESTPESEVNVEVLPVEETTSADAKAEPEVAKEDVAPAEPAPEPEAVVVKPVASALGMLFDDKTFALPEDQWGYVDEHGNVWQRDCALFTGRILGRIRGGDIESGLLLYGEEFKELESRCERLAKEVKKAKSKGSYLFRVHQMKVHLVEAVAIGDFDGLMKKLTDIEQSIADGIEKNMQRKEELCVRAEALSESTEWGKAGKELREMQAQWRALGQTDGEKTEELWKRFRVALDAFFENRAKRFEERNAIQRENMEKREVLCKESEELASSTSWKVTGERFEAIFEEWQKVGPVPKIEGDEQWKRFRKSRAEFAKNRATHFDDRKKIMRESAVKKEALCEQAEALSSSSEWNKTAKAIAELQEEWKKAGPTVKSKSDLLWKRFRTALDAFFDRRKVHYRQLDRERKENLRLKDNICRVAEELINSPDLRNAMDQAKELQAEWKLIGPVPRDKSDTIWDRFRKACDAVFNASRENYRERVRDSRNREVESKQRHNKNVERARQAIAEDEEQIQKWRDTIYRIHPGGRGEELKQALEKRIVDMEKSLVERRKRADDMAKNPGRERARTRTPKQPRLVAVAEPENLPKPVVVEEAKPEPEVVEVPVEVTPEPVVEITPEPASEPEAAQIEDKVTAEVEPEVAEFSPEPVEAEAEPEVVETEPEVAEVVPEPVEAEPKVVEAATEVVEAEPVAEETPKAPELADE